MWSLIKDNAQESPRDKHNFRLHIQKYTLNSVLLPNTLRERFLFLPLYKEKSEGGEKRLSFLYLIWLTVALHMFFLLFQDTVGRVAYLNTVFITVWKTPDVQN